MTDIAFSHLAIVVDDLQSALTFWRESLGLSQAGEIEFVAAEEVDAAFMTLGDAQIELIEPKTADSGIAKFLSKRGPGIHHLCLEVPDLDAKLARIKRARLPADQRDPARARRPSLRLHPSPQHRRRLARIVRAQVNVMRSNGLPARAE